MDDRVEMRVRSVSTPGRHRLLVVTVEVSVDGEAVGEVRVHDTPEGWNANGEDMYMLAHNASAQRAGLTEAQWRRQLAETAASYPDAFPEWPPPSGE